MVKTFNVLGVIAIAVGLLAGIFTGIYVSWLYAILYMASGVISALIFFAVAYIIELLEENNSYLRYLYNRVRDEDRANEAPAPAARRNSRSSLEKMKGYSFKGID